MEIKTYLTILTRRWWIILLVTLAVGIASVFASQLIPPAYKAETSLRVITPLIGSLGDFNYQTEYADRLINTYAQIAASEQVMTEVKAIMNMKSLPAVNVTTVPNSEIINISVTGSDPYLVATTANTLAKTVIAKTQENIRSEDTNSQDLNILIARQAVLLSDLNQAKLDREKLIQGYAQTSAQMNTLDKTIQMKETEYQNLDAQYQKAVVDEAVGANEPSAHATKNILSKEMSTLDAELSTMRKQFQDLSTITATYSQQVNSNGQTVQNKETAYENLLSQIDSVRIANSKHASAQELLIASPAVAPLKPTGPGKLMIIGLGFLCGLIGGVLLAFLINTLDTRVSTIEQIRSLTGLPILGSLPKLKRKDRNAPFKSTDITVQRACGMLCTKILAFKQSKPIKTILVTSPNPAEGKSTILLALAEGLAKANCKVLVVDTDLRKPGMLKLLHIDSKQGLANYLRGEHRLEDSILYLSNPGIHFLPSGIEDDDPITLFQSPAFTTLLEKISNYDIVLFDSPALLAVPDAYNLVMQMDGIILVVQRKRTTVEDIQTAMSQFEDVQSKLLGTIVNRVPQRPTSGYYNRKSAKLHRASPRLPGFTKPNTM